MKSPMTFKVLLSLFLSLALFSINATAHEGHGVPTGLQAQHGGEIKGGKQITLELFRTGTGGKEIQLFAMEHEQYKPIALSELKIAAVAKPQGKGKGTPVVFEPKLSTDAVKSHFAASFDPGNKRQVLEVTVTRGAKKDVFIFQLEPHS